MKRTLRATLLLVLLSAINIYAQQQSYTITDLGTLGGTYSSGASINKDGQVTGYASLLDGSSHAFLYSNGTMTDLGTLTGGTYSSGQGINDAGQVTGNSATSGHSVLRAFLYSNGAMTNLGTLAGGAYSSGNGINNAGQVTGNSYVSGYSGNHAFVDSNGVMADLGTLGGTISVGNGINDSGQVTGITTYPGNPAFRAFLYSSGTMSDIGTLGGQESEGYGINKAGYVTGSSSFDLRNFAGNHAFLYSNGKMTDLGTLGGARGTGYGINSAGQITGFSTVSGFSVPHAFLYTPGSSGMTDLNSLLPSNSGWILTYGYGINDSGQITGEGTINGQTHAFLLSPSVSPIKQLTTALTNLINGTSLNTQTKTLLLNVVNLLPAQINTLSPAQKAIAITIMNRFIGALQSLQARNRLTASQASQLIAVAQDVINVLKS